MFSSLSFLSLSHSLPINITIVIAIAIWASAARADDLVFNYTAYSLEAQFGKYPHHEHHATGTTSPLLLVNEWHKERMCPTGSHIFLRNDANGDSGPELDTAPLILSADDLSAVYVDRRYQSVFDVRVQNDRGQDYLTFFGGPISGMGLGNGYSYVFDSSYRQVYRVAAQNLAVKADLHEFELTGHGTALLTAYDIIVKNLARPRSRRRQIRDSVFQEIELETNKVLFQWRASDHIDLYTSREKMASPWDFFHLNSIQKTADGNYLLCARHTHSIYLIDGTTGDVIWVLGGQANQFFELPPANGISVSNPALSMSWQHHARFYPGSQETEITLFDNHALPINGFNCTANCSRGLHLKIDTSDRANMTVQILHEYLHPKGLLSQSQGSMQVLDNGNVFIGWGRNPSFTEHTIDGECVFDVLFSPWRSPATNGDGLDNYRTYRMDWKATPYWDPAIAIENHEGVMTAYVSWNGATEVKSWVLLASDSPTELSTFDNMVARLPRAGFETAIHLGYTEAQYFRAAALDIDQRVIGSTGIYDVRSGKLSKANETISGTTGHTIEESGTGKNLGSIAIDFGNGDLSEWGSGWTIASLLFMSVGLLLSGYFLASRRKHLCTILLRAGKNPTASLPRFFGGQRLRAYSRVNDVSLAGDDGETKIN